MQQYIVSIVYILIGLSGLFGVFFTYSIVKILIKHRRDNAPLTVFMLKPIESEKYINLFTYPAVFILLTGVSTVMQRFVGQPNFSNFLFTIFFSLYYAFGLITIIVFLHVVYEWYKMMRRFA